MNVFIYERIHILKGAIFLAGLREKRKNESRNKILIVSKEIFFTKGYSNTTIEEIAEKAGIGVGTVYNFFKTKADLLISAVSSEVGGEDHAFRPEDADLEQGTADIVLNFTWRTIGKMKFLSKKIWKELMSATFSTLKSENGLFSGMARIDTGYVQKLKTLLEDLKTRGVLPSHFDADSASQVVYSIFVTQFMLYIYSEEITLEQLKSGIRRQLEFVFHQQFKNGEC